MVCSLCKMNHCNASQDIPDVAGDSRAGVHTLSVRLGPRRVFWTCIALLELGYIGAVVAAVGSSHFLSQVAGVVAHATLALVLLWRARQTDISSSKSVYRCCEWQQAEGQC